MVDLPFLISIFIFSGILLLIIGAFSYMKYRKEHNSLIEKIKQDGSIRDRTHTRHAPASAHVLKELSNNILKRYFMKLILMTGKLLKPKTEQELSYMQKTFLRAGYRSKKAMSIYFGIKGLCTFGLPAAFFFLQIFVLKLKIMKPIYLLLILILLAMIGFYFPYIWLRLKTSRRKDRIFKGFPDMLDLLVVCVEAGVGLNAAIYRVSEELKLSHREISEELQILNWELKAGKPRRAALKNLATRIDLEDVNSLVSLLIQTEKFGTSVAKALRVYSDTMRSKRYQRAEEMAAKIAVKLLFPLIFCIFPALFITILGPALIQVLKIWK